LQIKWHISAGFNQSTVSKHRGTQNIDL